MNGEVFGLVPSRSRHLRPGSSRAVEVTRRWALNLTIRVYAKQHLQLSKSWDHHRIPWLGLAPELPQFKTAGDVGPRTPGVNLTVASAGNICLGLYGLGADCLSKLPTGVSGARALTDTRIPPGGAASSASRRSTPPADTFRATRMWPPGWQRRRRHSPRTRRTPSAPSTWPDSVRDLAPAALRCAWPQCWSTACHTPAAGCGRPS